MIRLQRIKYEFGPTAYSPPGISLWQDENEEGKCHAEIIPGEDTPYNNIVFRLEVQIPEKYPFVPPDVRFKTPVYHPNIDPSGRICLDALKMPPIGAWTPCTHIRSLLMMVKQLLAEPNPDDPVMPNIAQEYKFNRPLFCHNAREYSKKTSHTSTDQHSSQRRFSSESTSSLRRPSTRESDSSPSKKPRLDLL